MITEIVLGAATGVASLGAGGLGWLVRRKGKAAEAEITGLNERDLAMIHGLHERIDTLEENLRQKDAALSETLGTWQHAEDRRLQAVVEHEAAVAALKAEHAVQVAQLEGEFAGAMAAGQRTAQRLETLLAGHDFHVGGKVKSHGRDLILYNCVTCSPETNVRVIAPEGFFAGGDQWLAQT